MSPSAADRQGGFALIESIAVLALSALVLFGLLIAGNLVTRNSGAAARRVNAVEALATGVEALRRDVSRARFARSGPGAQDPVLFQGASQSLGFVVGADGGGLGENLIWIEARSDGKEGALVRSSAQLLPQMTGFAGASFANPAVLMTGPWSYRFSYAELGAGAPQWMATWATAKGPPDAVRLEVLDAAGARAVLPPVVIPLHVDAELPCQTEGCEQEENDDADPGNDLRNGGKRGDEEQ